MATRLVASEHAGDMICPCPICRTTLVPERGVLATCLFAAAACAAVMVPFGSFAACATWFEIAACAFWFAVFWSVVACEVACGAVLVVALALGCCVFVLTCAWRPVSVASALFTSMLTGCPFTFPLITLPEFGCG